MVEKLKQVSTYVIVLFVVGIFAYLITGFGEDLRGNPNAELSASSLTYIGEMTGSVGKESGFNTSIYGEDIGNATGLGGTDNKNEFSLDFSFGDKSGSKVERVIYVIFNIPEFILSDIFRILTLQWLIDLIDWLFNIMLFIAVVQWIRKGE